MDNTGILKYLRMILPEHFHKESRLCSWCYPQMNKQATVVLEWIDDIQDKETHNTKLCQLTELWNHAGSICILHIVQQPKNVICFHFDIVLIF